MRVILNGRKDVPSDYLNVINGFTYVQTDFDYATGELNVVRTKSYSDGPSCCCKMLAVPMTFAKVLLLCVPKVLTYQLPVTQPTQTFPTPCCRYIQKECMEAGKKFSQLLRVVVLGRTFTPTTWVQVPLLTV